MKTTTKVDIAVLKTKLDQIQNNELVHLKADIQEVREDLKGDIADLKTDMEKLVDKVDNLSVKLAYWSGGIAVLVILIHYLMKI